MKNVIILIIFCCSFCSCIKQKSPWEIELEQREKQEKEEKKEIMRIKRAMKDSIVSLSFKGIVLGESFSDFINNGKQNKEFRAFSIDTIDENISEAYSRTNILLPSKNDSVVSTVDVSVRVYAYNDKIYSILLSSYEYDTYWSLKWLYYNKYNHKLADTSTDYNYDTESSLTSWSYKNQSIILKIKSTVKTEYYVKDATKRYYANRYGSSTKRIFDKIEIEYTDINNKENYEKYVKYKEKREQQVKDSIKNIEDSIKRRNDSIESSELMKNSLLQEI